MSIWYQANMIKLINKLITLLDGKQSLGNTAGCYHHITRQVDGMLTSEVTPVITQYILTPHHGHQNVTDMFMNDRQYQWA